MTRIDSTFLIDRETRDLLKAWEKTDKLITEYVSKIAEQYKKEIDKKIMEEIGRK